MGCLFTSSSISLAVLENLVHFSRFTAPLDMRCVTFEIPDSQIITADEDLDPATDKSVYIIGDKWLESSKSLGLKVPSAVVHAEYNILINPRHPAISKVKVIDNVLFPFDNRLFLRI